MKLVPDHPQYKFCGVIKRSHEVTPLVSYLDFPNTASVEGDIWDWNFESTSDMNQFA